MKLRIEPNRPNITASLKDHIVVYWESGKEPQHKTLTITENNEYEIAPDPGYILEKVNLTVDVPIPDGYLVPEGTLAVDKVGEYDVTTYATANFTVPTEEVVFTPAEQAQEYAPTDSYITQVVVKTQFLKNTLCRKVRLI